MAEYILIYDIPRQKKVLQVTINRQLKRMKAEKFQHSTWSSEKLTELKKIATLIKQNGGIANILEKKIVF